MKAEVMTPTLNFDARILNRLPYEDLLKYQKDPNKYDVFYRDGNTTIQEKPMAAD